MVTLLVIAHFFLRYEGDDDKFGKFLERFSTTYVRQPPIWRVCYLFFPLPTITEVRAEVDKGKNHNESTLICGSFTVGDGVVSLASNGEFSHVDCTGLNSECREVESNRLFHEDDETNIKKRLAWQAALAEMKSVCEDPMMFRVEIIRRAAPFPLPSAPNWPIIRKRSEPHWRYLFEEAYHREREINQEIERREYLKTISNETMESTDADLDYELANSAAVMSCFVDEVDKLCGSQTWSTWAKTRESLEEYACEQTDHGEQPGQIGAEKELCAAAEACILQQLVRSVVKSWFMQVLLEETDRPDLSQKLCIDWVAMAIHLTNKRADLLAWILLRLYAGRQPELVERLSRNASPDAQKTQLWQTYLQQLGYNMDLLYSREDAIPLLLAPFKFSLTYLYDVLLMPEAMETNINRAMNSFAFTLMNRRKCEEDDLYSNGKHHSASSSFPIVDNEPSTLETQMLLTPNAHTQMHGTTKLYEYERWQL
ncbi:PREDICTED: uncharacterized protein LOC106807697 [Priapulus caudatus]|uniref:Uncharacterized protein LOC106807697 n=1 Tax=Priapulus caudatus TaxID=37621 RepID=A0ABM1E093_PRICU|nr:PREDICTED: uncharacterized protein LOC106807697 [Priapulus caudatus]